MCQINANEVWCEHALAGDKACPHYWHETPIITLWDETSIVVCDYWWRMRVLEKRPIEYHECIDFEVLMGMVEQSCQECDERLNPPCTTGWCGKLKEAWDNDHSKPEGQGGDWEEEGEESDW